MGTHPLLITPFIPLVEAWLRADLAIKGTVVHERLVTEYGFAAHYQRVKMFLWCAGSTGAMRVTC